MREYTEVGTITILGEEWSYGYGYPGKTRGKTNDGKCYYSRNRIVIDPQHTCSLLDVVAHEVAHAYFRNEREKVINSFGKAVDEIYNNLSSQPTRQR